MSRVKEFPMPGQFKFHFEEVPVTSLECQKKDKIPRGMDEIAGEVENVLYNAKEDPSMYTTVNKSLKQKCGLCLSAGGIRSGTFSLGVLEAFCSPEFQKFANLDYISTVSGGGYTTCSFFTHYLPLYKRYLKRKSEPSTDGDEDVEVELEGEAARNEENMERFAYVNKIASTAWKQTRGKIKENVNFLMGASGVWTNVFFAVFGQIFIQILYYLSLLFLVVNILYFGMNLTMNVPADVNANTNQMYNLTNYWIVTDDFCTAEQYSGLMFYRIFPCVLGYYSVLNDVQRLNFTIPFNYGNGTTTTPGLSVFWGEVTKYNSSLFQSPMVFMILTLLFLGIVVVSGPILRMQVCMFRFNLYPRIARIKRNRKMTLDDITQTEKNLSTVGDEGANDFESYESEKRKDVGLVEIKFRSIILLFFYTIVVLLVIVLFSEVFKLFVFFMGVYEKIIGSDLSAFGMFILTVLWCIFLLLVLWIHVKIGAQVGNVAFAIFTIFVVLLLAARFTLWVAFTDSYLLSWVDRYIRNDYSPLGLVYYARIICMSVILIHKLYSKLFPNFIAQGYRMYLRKAFFKGSEEVDMTELVNVRPYYLIGCTLNNFFCTDNLQECQFGFEFSPRRFGSRETGYIRVGMDEMKGGSRAFVSRLAKLQRRFFKRFSRIPLSAAMTISAAAFSVGDRTISVYLRMIMAFLQITLGSWVYMDQSSRTQPRGEKRKRSVFTSYAFWFFDTFWFLLFTGICVVGLVGVARNESSTFHVYVVCLLSFFLLLYVMYILKIIWPSIEIGYPANLDFVRLINLISGTKQDRNSSFVHVSDGAALDCLGLVLLLRRELDKMYCFDVGQDEQMSLIDLHKAIFTSIEEGVIEDKVLIEDETFDIKDLMRRNPSVREFNVEASRKHFIVFEVVYKSTQKRGTIFFGKATLTGNEKPMIKLYAAFNEDFPHTPTLNQFFDQTKFHAYERLGFHIASEILKYEREMEVGYEIVDVVGKNQNKAEDNNSGEEENEKDAPHKFLAEEKVVTIEEKREEEESEDEEEDSGSGETEYETATDEEEAE